MSHNHLGRKLRCLTIRRPYERVAIAFILLFACFIPSISAGEQGLDITGFVDHSPIREADPFQLTINIVNKGKEGVQLLSVEVIPGPKGSCGNFTHALLQSGGTFTQTCQVSLQKQGQYNLGVKVYWVEEKQGAMAQSVSKNLLRITVWPSEPFINWEILPAAAALVLFLALVGYLIMPRENLRRWATSLRESYSDFHMLCGFSVLFSFFAAVWGLRIQSATIVIAAFFSALVSAVLALAGKDSLKELITRLTKAGPFEFSPLAGRTQEAEVLRKTEEVFYLTETRIGDIFELVKKIDHHIELSRLKAYSTETALIPYNITEIPPDSDSIEERLQWLYKVQAEYKTNLAADFFKHLRALYDDILNQQRFKQFFGDNLKTILEKASIADGEDQRALVLQAQREMGRARPSILSQHYFAAVSSLHVILKEDEKALATLYEGYSHFPEGIRTCAVLGWYLTEINRDFPGAEKYLHKALKIVKEEENKISEYYSACDIYSSPKPPLALHLETTIKNHQKKWRTELGDWLKNFQIVLKNNLACYIAFGRIVGFEDDARTYALAAYNSDPDDPRYIETLAFVKLAFASSLRGGKNDEIREAIALLDKAIKRARDDKNEFTLDIAQSHRRQAIEVLRMK